MFFASWIILNIVGLKSSLGDGDESLWNGFLEGDKEALSSLFLRNYGDLYRYGMKINSNEEVVRDCIQDLFFRLWTKRKRLEKAISPKKYLLVSLRRILLRNLYRQHSQEERNHEYSRELVQNNSSHIEFMIQSEIAQERHDSLNQAFSELTDRQKEVLFLKFYQGYDNREISEIINVSYQRVCNITHEAIQKLRNEIL